MVYIMNYGFIVLGGVNVLYVFAIYNYAPRGVGEYHLWTFNNCSERISCVDDVKEYLKNHHEEGEHFESDDYNELASDLFIVK